MLTVLGPNKWCCQPVGTRSGTVRCDAPNTHVTCVAREATAAEWSVPLCDGGMELLMMSLHRFVVATAKGADP